MEIRKIANRLSFEVEAQERCPHGYKMWNPTCSETCQHRAFTMESEAMYWNRNNVPCKCYMWGLNYSCYENHRS